MMSTTRRRRAMMTAGLAAAAVMLSGCSIDAGSSAASAIEKEFSNVEGVASVTAQGLNTLPFAGSVSVLIVTEPELADERVDELAQQITDYTGSHGGGVSWDTVALDADAIRVALSADDNENSTRLSIARDLIAPEYAVAASVGIGAQRVPGQSADLTDQTPGLITVAVDDSASLIDAYTAAATAAPSITTQRSETNTVAITTDGTFVLDDESTQEESAPFADALDSFSSVTARYDLIGAHITPQTIMVRAAQEERVPEIQGFLAGLPAASGLEADVQGGNVTTTESTSPAAQSVASEIGALGTVSAGDDTVMVEVSEFRDAREVFAAARQSPDFTALLSFGIRAPDVIVQTAPDSFENALTIGESALDTDTISRMNATSEGYKFWLEGTSDDQLTAFVNAVKPGLVAGGWTTFVSSGSFNGWFEATDVVTFDDGHLTPDRSQQRTAERFAELWDAASRY